MEQNTSVHVGHYVPNPFRKTFAMKVSKRFIRESNPEKRPGNLQVSVPLWVIAHSLKPEHVICIPWFCVWIGHISWYLSTKTTAILRDDPLDMAIFSILKWESHISICFLCAWTCWFWCGISQDFRWSPLHWVNWEGFLLLWKLKLSAPRFSLVVSTLFKITMAY